MNKLTSICYVIPYFGKLPAGFEMWLLSCGMNSTIDWILYTDDKTEYNYPENVKVKYCTYEDIKEKIQRCYDFKVNINRPWKLCEFKPAYGDIFSDDLVEYDFWGHCDMDLIWGDIRSFVTEKILEKYDKIGFQGHSTLYRNAEDVNNRYKISIDGILDYKTAFRSTEMCHFDEVIMTELYDALSLPQYVETNFAHLDRFTTSFYLLYLPDKDGYKNDRQIFIWENGKIIRNYIDGKEVKKQEFMYIHLFSRPISFRIKEYSNDLIYVIYPDVVRTVNKEQLNYKFVRKKGTCRTIEFYVKIAFYYRKKLTIKKILYHLKKKAHLAAKRGFK